MRLPLRCRAVRLAGGALLVALLAACAGPGVRVDDRDGPEARPPPGLLQVPDAEPAVEPIRQGGPNKPYTVWGQSYVPLVADAPLNERGLASWYGRKFNGKPTASGELYNMYAMTAAHPTLPIPSYARIRNPANGREVVVRINDRGPFKSRRIVDLSYTAALKLGILGAASPVELERITGDDIRAGTWRHAPVGPRDGADTAARVASAAPAEAPSRVALPVPPVGAPRAASPAPTVVPPQAAATVPAPPVDPLQVAAAAADSVVLAADRSPALLPPDTVAPAIGDVTGGVAGTAAGRGFWVQLGAFREHDGAVAFQKQVEARVGGIAPLLTVFADATLFRLQAGPYARRDEARDAGERLRDALRLVPVIVERR